MRSPIQEERIYPILKSVHTIGVLAEMIGIEYQNHAVSIKFKQPSTNQHASRIRESANQITKDLAFQFKVTDRDTLTYEHALQLHRLVSHFIDLGIERTTEFMDLVDEGKLVHTADEAQIEKV